MPPVNPHKHATTGAVLQLGTWGCDIGYISKGEREMWHVFFGCLSLRLCIEVWRDGRYGLKRVGLFLDFSLGHLVKKAT